MSESATRVTASDKTAAVLGLGEVGAEFARGLLEAGWVVQGWDPDARRVVPGVEQMAGPIDAAHGTVLVISATTASASRSAADSVVPALGGGVVYADLNTAGADLKRQLAATIETTGAVFADVAVMSPVPGKGVHLPLIVSGSGAERFADLLLAAGASVEVVPGGPGAAASRKLIRSVFMKGLAAAVLEGRDAAVAAGCEEWFLQDVAGTLAAADRDLVSRLIDGSSKHSLRRVDELEAVAELLRELGVTPRLTEAAKEVIAGAGA
jgi:3-hydroxyisobutyrate dehydrogenase-like beta-hydroxyacid dehydrogenase